MNDLVRSTFVGAFFLALFACGSDRSEIVEAKLDPEAVIAKAISNPTRPEDDRGDDSMRKPGAVLTFIGVEPGIKLFEVEAGRGYYTELFSQIIGAEGSITAQNPETFDNFLNGAIEARIAGGRLQNVRPTKSMFDELEAADQSVDLVTWMLGPHELFFKPAGVDSLGDPAAAFAEIRRILKPGGVFIILDHVAAPGTPASSGDSLHRIDPSIVKALAAEAGFVLVDESDVLHNPDDQYGMNVFDPAVRRKTDRFLLKYKKAD